MSIIYDIEEFRNAGSGAVVRLRPEAKDTHSYFADYNVAVLAVDAIANLAPLHISGPSGTGKSHFLNSLLFGPRINFYSICNVLDLKLWAKMKCHRIYVSSYEVPSEIFYKDRVVNFSSILEPQEILKVLREAEKDRKTLHVVWLVESGRGITPEVQGGWLEVVGQRVIREPHGQVFQAQNVTFVTDSNHAANRAGEFVIFTLDQSYARRFTRRILHTPLMPEQELEVLRELAPQANPEHVRQVVRLTAALREKQREGLLTSVLPPTIDTEVDLLGTMTRLALDSRTLVFNTILGHVPEEDNEEAENVFAQAFGIEIKANSPAGEAIGVI